LGFGFPIASLPPVREQAELATTVSAAITTERTLRLLRALTHGTLRYRIEWASAGRRRSLTYRVADRVFRSHPELVNEPRAAAWQIVVDEKPRRLTIEIRPGRLDDPRFTYRRRLLPAASHPTIAAALARVAGVRTDDVVWDPFVGTATELIERARLGPYRMLMGSDSDSRALDAARENLHAASVRAELALADARTHRPHPRPTLVLTNPPLGRRLLREAGVADLYIATLTHITQVAARDVRLIWISPLPDLTDEHARRLGFQIELRQRIDMGGFQAELQRLDLRSR
jgi:predicted RNA methylase